MSMLPIALLLSLVFGVAETPRSTPLSKRGGDVKSSRLPPWLRGMPEADAPDYLDELEKREAKGKTITVRAICEHFREVALSRKMRDPKDNVHYSGTTIAISEPKKFKGTKAIVLHPDPPSTDSCWRRRGCNIEFDINERTLEIVLVGLQDFLSASQIRQVRIP
jgi:hypothetical protein